jgi:hypothetical protein
MTRSSLPTIRFYKEKLAFIEQHHLVVFRLHDEIHTDTTDHILIGMYEVLGWDKYPHPPGPRRQYFVTIPQVTLAELSRSLQSKLHIQTVRVEGDLNLILWRDSRCGIQIMAPSRGLRNDHGWTSTRPANVKGR